MGSIAAHSIPNTFFILRKEYTVVERRKLIKSLCEIFDVVGIDKEKIMECLDNENFSDFEDCLQMECAKEYGADYIITRNVNDFKFSEIKVVEPSEFLNLKELKEKMA